MATSLHTTCLCICDAWIRALRIMNPQLIILFIIVQSYVSSAVEVTRPRGVALTKNVFYDPGRDFTCLDGSISIPFRYVNDDYCDCADGTDEPGTSACPNGFFHCTNAGHKPLNIPSSRVNDGICDCCDASDEYNSSANCVNQCKELGRRAREEAQRLLDIMNRGFEQKQLYSQQGKQQKEERKNKLSELEQHKAALNDVKMEKEALKTQAEELEKVALDKYKSEEEERKKQEESKRQEEEREREAEEAFADLDTDQDGKLTVEEIQSRWVFDSNKDGQVTVEEAKFFLMNNENMDLEQFKRIGWMLMKPHYSLLNQFKAPEEQAPEQEQTATPIPETTDTENEKEHLMGDENDEIGDHIPYGEDEGEEGEEDEEEEESVDTPKFPDPEVHPPKTTEESVPQYDDETQRLIDIANEARTAFNEAETSLRDAERELENVQKVADVDFGPDEEFSPLHGHCFEYTDREYTYKLCPFDKSVQVPKSGGSETNLGHWGKWDGTEDNKYKKMKYENGLGCWNGPSRSTDVRLNCGPENQLTMVTEPNRCEYLFEFTTPAVCSQPSARDLNPSHDEL